MSFFMLVNILQGGSGSASHSFERENPHIFTLLVPFVQHHITVPDPPLWMPLTEGIIYLLRLESVFLVSNSVSLLCCVLSMFLCIVTFGLRFPGFVLDYSSRFLVEILFNSVYLCRHCPTQARTPPLRELRKDLGSSVCFTLVFVLGFTVEKMLFEVVPMIFFQIKVPFRTSPCGCPFTPSSFPEGLAAPPADPKSTTSASRSASS